MSEDDFDSPEELRLGCGILAVSAILAGGIVALVSWVLL